MHYQRRSIRLPGYDYSQSGVYFITVCVNGHEHLFGRINNKKMILNLYGQIVHSKWIDIPKHFENAHLDVFQIMPDHLHGIIILTHHTDDGVVGAKHCSQDSGHLAWVPARNASPLRYQQPPESSHPNGTKRGSISAIMQNFSSVTTRKINQIRNSSGHKIWQRGYYDHIIRNQNELWAIQRYIITNPSNWDKQ
jgi:REP element-mobilizing transposase RayT